MAYCRYIPKISENTQNDIPAMVGNSSVEEPPAVGNILAHGNVHWTYMALQVFPNFDFLGTTMGKRSTVSEKKMFLAGKASRSRNDVEKILATSNNQFPDWQLR